MDQIDFTREITFFLPFFLLLLPLFFLLLKKNIGSSSLKHKPLPPGPRPWPIIGNILHMGQNPHVSTAQFSKLHGPIISLRLGSQFLVVGTTAAAATEILKTQDRLLSGRHVPQMIPIKHDINRVSLVLASGTNDQLRYFRGLCRAELFSTKSIESQALLRERKVNEMVSFLGTKEGKVVRIAEVVFTTVFNTLANMIFSKDFIPLEDEGVAGGLKNNIRTMMELGTTPNLADFFPLLKGFDLQGLYKKAVALNREVCDVWEVIIKDRRQSLANSTTSSPKQKDFLDVMLANELADDQIDNLAHELFTAGTDTTTSTIEWVMAELVKNKGAMDKVREELTREFNQNSIITESSLPQLSYLHACIKEALRLHPPVPFLLPHRAIDTCEVMNYTIPKDSEVFVNIWAIGRDPKAWEDPLVFKPERFLDSNMDFRGQDFDFLPFGAGRRMCPGLPMATKAVHLILAHLIHSFEWSLPNNEDPALLDMNEKFGVTLQKVQPLLLIPKQKV